MYQDPNIYDAEFVDIPDSQPTRKISKVPRARRISPPVRRRRKKATSLQMIRPDQVVAQFVREANNPVLSGLFAFFREVTKKRRAA